MPRRGHGETDWPALVASTAAAVWGWRLELTVVALVLALHALVAAVVGAPVAAVVVVALSGLVLALAPARRRLGCMLWAARVRRAWARALADTGLSDGPLHAPRVLGVRRITAGDMLRVRVARGQSVASLEGRARELAACMRVRAVRVEGERADAAIARVTLVRRDPFDDPSPLPWPAAGTPELSLWEPVPLGVDEHGETVGIGLVERNVLVGGEPGAGKSVALSLLVAAGALDPGARVWLLDGKLVELAAWAPVAERLVGPDGAEAITLLRDVQAEMEARYMGVRRVVVPVARDDAGGLVVYDLPSIAPTLSRARVTREDAEPLLGPERGEIADVLTRFLRAYLAGDASALAYLMPPGTRVAAATAAGRFELLSVGAVESVRGGSERERVVLVTVHARDRGSRTLYMLRYRARLLRRDRWYVAEINVGRGPR